MMNFRKLLPVVAIFTVFFGLIGSASAQQDVICAGLNEEDCALYTELSLDTALPTSTAFELNTNFTISGAEPEPVSFNLGANGAYVFDEAAAQAAIDEFGALSILDVDLRSLLNLSEGVVDAFDAELTLDLSGLPADAGLPFNSVDLWLVDGIGYADLSPIVMFLGPDAEPGVYGMDMFELIETPLNGVTMEQLFALGDMMGSGLGNPALSSNEFTDAFTQGFQSGMAGAALTDEDISAFASVERLADEDGLAVFVTTIDVAGVFEVDFIRQQALNSLETNDMPDDVDPEAFIDAIAEAISGSTMVVTERYNIEESYLVSSDFVMDITVNTSALASIDESLAVDDAPTLEIDVTGDFTRSDVNQIESIDLPEGTTVVPLSSLMGGGAGA